MTPIARVGLACGRMYLAIGKLIVAMETDPCRDPKLLGMTWNEANLNDAAYKINSNCPYAHCVGGYLELHGPELEIKPCPHCKPEDPAVPVLLDARKGREFHIDRAYQHGSMALHYLQNTRVAASAWSMNYEWSQFINEATEALHYADYLTPEQIAAELKRQTEGNVIEVSAADIPF